MRAAILLAALALSGCGPERITRAEMARVCSLWGEVLRADESTNVAVRMELDVLALTAKDAGALDALLHGREANGEAFMANTASMADHDKMCR